MDQIKKPEWPEHVANSELRLEDIPSSDADWYANVDFAHSFWAYREIGPGLSGMANAASSNYRKTEILPASLTELRACLFFEYRRAVHLGEPTPHMRKYAAALISAIRAIVEKGSLDV